MKDDNYGQYLPNLKLTPISLEELRKKRDLLRNFRYPPPEKPRDTDAIEIAENLIEGKIPVQFQQETLLNLRGLCTLLDCKLTFIMENMTVAQNLEILQWLKDVSGSDCYDAVHYLSGAGILKPIKFFGFYVIGRDPKKETCPIKRMAGELIEWDDMSLEGKPLSLETVINALMRRINFEKRICLQPNDRWHACSNKDGISNSGVLHIARTLISEKCPDNIGINLSEQHFIDNEAASYLIAALRDPRCANGININLQCNFDISRDVKAEFQRAVKDYECRWVKKIWDQCVTIQQGRRQSKSVLYNFNNEIFYHHILPYLFSPLVAFSRYARDTVPLSLTEDPTEALQNEVNRRYEIFIEQSKNATSPQYHHTERNHELLRFVEILFNQFKQRNQFYLKVCCLFFFICTGGAKHRIKTKMACFEKIIAQIKTQQSQEDIFKEILSVTTTNTGFWKRKEPTTQITLRELCQTEFKPLKSCFEQAALENKMNRS
jgi:hypothetical protein